MRSAADSLHDFHPLRDRILAALACAGIDADVTLSWHDWPRAAPLGGTGYRLLGTRAGLCLPPSHPKAESERSRRRRERKISQVQRLDSRRVWIRHVYLGANRSQEELRSERNGRPQGCRTQI